MAVAKENKLVRGKDLYYVGQRIKENFVAKEDGKGLSTNDYTTEEKTKLAAIESGAQKNVKPDWNAASGDAQILHKPSIPTKTSDLTNDSGFVTSDDIPEGVQPATANPKMDGTAAVGSSAKYAKEDHVHPSDSSKADKATTLAGYGITNAYTKAEVDTAISNKQDAIADLSDIRSGAALGSTSVQPADIENMVEAEPIGSIIPPVNPSEFATTEEVSQLQQDVADNTDNINALQAEIDGIQPIVIEGNVTNAPDEEDITTDENDLLKFADRTTAVNQMGYVILRKNKTFAEQVTQSNTIYEIRYDFDLGGASVTIPTGCVLRFNGGKLNNGILTGNNTIIDADKITIFTSTTLSGSFVNDKCFPEWWGAKGDGITDDRRPIQYAIDSGFRTVYLSDRTYLVASINPEIESNTVGFVISKPCRIIGDNTKRITGSLCIISFASAVSFDAGVLIDSPGVFISDIFLQGANTYNVNRMISSSFDGTNRQELKLKNLKIDYAQNGIHISTYLSVLDNIRVSNITGDGIYLGGTNIRYPTNEIKNCYVLTTQGIAYNIVNCSISTLYKCYAERCGFVGNEEATEANTYPAYNIEGARGVSIIGCGTEACAKPVNVKDGESVTFSGCSFHSLFGTFATISGELSQFVFTGTLKGLSLFSCNFIGYADQLIIIGDNVVNTSFDSCSCYNTNHPSYSPLSKDYLSRFDPLSISISANRGISIYDYDANNHIPADNISGSLGADLAKYDKKYDFFGKVLTSTAGSQGSTSRTITNYKGELVIQFPGATSGNRVTFYADVNITECDKVVFKDMYTEQSTVTRFKFTKSVVVFDSCTFTFVSGRAAFMTLSNCTVIIKNCTFNTPENAPANFLLSALDQTSTIIIEDATGKYLTKDGKRGIRSVTTTERPASAPVGEAYFDETLGKPIWYTGSGWVDATGTAVYPPLTDRLK